MQQKRTLFTFSKNKTVYSSSSNFAPCSAPSSPAFNSNFGLNFQAFSLNLNSIVLFATLILALATAFFCTSCDDDSSSSNYSSRIIYYSTLTDATKKSTLSFFTSGSFSYRPPIGTGENVYTKIGGFSGDPTKDGETLALHVGVVSNVATDFTPYDIEATVSGTTIILTDENDSSSPVTLYKNGIETKLISFDLNEGTIEADQGVTNISAIEVQKNGTMNLPTTTLTYEGKTFLGWAKNKNETDFNNIYAPGALCVVSSLMGLTFENLTLYAIFSDIQPLKYKVGSGAESLIEDASQFDFLASGGSYTFSGLMSKTDFCAIMAKVQKVAADITLDFSACVGVKFVCDEGTAVNTLCGIATRDSCVAHLKSIKLPSNLTKIPSYAFYKCTALDKLILPKALESIGEHIIEKSGVESFEIETGNTHFTLGSNGELLLAGGEVLLLMPSVTTLTAYTTPATVTTISSNAFLMSEDCPITTFTIGNTVTKVGTNCTPKTLTSLTLGSALKEISSGSFSELTALTALTVPSSVETIGEDAFSGCSALTSITLNEGLLQIGKRAFDSTAITTLTIPKSVTTVMDLAFNNCDDLSAISVAADSTAYKSDGGVLYKITNENGSEKFTLIKYPPKKTGTSYTVLDGTVEIAPGAFSGATTLSEVCIRSSVKTINASAWYSSPFFGCNKNLIIKLAYSRANVPSTFGSAWNYYEDAKSLSVTYGWVAPVAP